MPFEIRVPDEGELYDFMLPVWRVFGEPAPTDEHLEDERAIWEPERSIGVVDGGQWVGGAGVYSFRMTLPGGADLPVAGVTMVGVAPTHRRQGVLTSLMARQLDDVADRGEAVAVLTASETTIYGRFGYGWATDAAGVDLETARSAFRTEPRSGGRLRQLRVADALAPISEAYERCRSLRPGTLTRSDAYHELMLRDRPRWRDGASALYVVVHDDAQGRPDGFATYRIAESWARSLPDHTVVVNDLYGADPEVEATLWRFLCDLDLVTRVRAKVRPVDEPLRARLREPRRLRINDITDYLWVRVLDVPAALSARRYGTAGSLVVEVVDGFRPGSGGSFRVEGGPDGAACTRTDAPPDLTMAADDLGALYLGGIAATTLAGARRIEEQRDGALAEADAMFRSTPAPFNGTMF